MAGFCTKCGSPIGDDVRFCLQCGTPVAPPPTAAQGPAPAAPAVVGAAGAAPGAAPAKSGSAAVKIIVGLLAFFALVTLLGIGSCVYVGYRVRKRARELSQTYRFDTTQSATSRRAATARDVCSLVTKEEVGEALGTTISEASGGTSSCQYTAAAGNNQALGVVVTWQGGALAMKFAGMAFKGVGGGQGSFQPLAGIGDEAYIGPMGSTLMFRKGDVMVNIDLRMIGNNVDAAKVIAQKIAARL
ncbi:MAG: zinc ribbon domain-containing protein [Terriglobia bacterium]|jgi:hypothetical protein